jgi:hypothetical protein
MTISTHGQPARVPTVDETVTTARAALVKVRGMGWSHCRHEQEIVMEHIVRCHESGRLPAREIEDRRRDLARVTATLLRAAGAQ